jgi:hypothetical protein
MAGMGREGDSWIQNVSARVLADYQKLCYHVSTVHVKENLEVIEEEGDRLRRVASDPAKRGVNW